MAEANPFEQFRAAASLRARDLAPDTAALAPALLDSTIDLHPHQIEAAAFALTRRFGRGAILADEVGLGKTIEAGLVVSERLAEGPARILILVPASLRLQWCAELQRCFAIHARLLDARAVRRARARPPAPGVHVASLDWFQGDSVPEAVRGADWDLVVIDEAHRLRNVWRRTARRARRLRERLRRTRKLLLTATPLQNSLLELYGLVSFVDERLLGSEATFRARFLADERGLAVKDPAELSRRLESVLHRTLRRQVSDSIRFTARHSLLCDFEPGPAEAELYRRMSEWLSTSRAIGLAFGNRALLLLAYRKILASSSFAVAATLRRLIHTLGERLKGVPATIDPAEDLDGLDEEAERLSDRSGEDGPAVGRAEIEHEIALLRSYLALAESIETNAKGERLVAALGEVLARAAARDQPAKAVIFTESRRTQDYLAGLLARRGFAGRVTVFHGGVGDAGEREARLEEFRRRTSILLSTEAGAEGLNLQFCNVVVNYDLPWNPQRIEQRIGRCHRYGQPHDVLVVNFLATSNAADRRLYELLACKLRLFDGVFGSSDEVLGALESGVDFERRVLDIYQGCRTAAEIDRAFAALRAELDAASPLPAARLAPRLIDRLDDELAARLERRRDLVAHGLGDVRRELQTLVLGLARKVEALSDGDSFRLELGGEVPFGLAPADCPATVRFAPGAPGAVLGPRHPLVRALVRHALAGEGARRVHEVVVPAAGALAAARGRRGYWLVELIAIDGLDREARVIDVAALEGEEGELGAEEIAALAAAGSRHRGYSELAPPAELARRLEAALERRVAAELERAGRLARRALGEEQERLERYREEARRDGEERLRRGREALARERERCLAGGGEGAGRGIADLLAGQLRHEERLLAEDEARRAAESAAALGEIADRSVPAARRLARALARFWLV